MLFRSQGGWTKSGDKYVRNADGSYTYTVDQANATVQALNVGSTALSDVFTYTVKDAAGLTSSTTLTVSVHGANDAPVFSADVTRTTLEDTTFEEQVSSLLVGQVTDVDSAGMAGIGIVWDFGNRNGNCDLCSILDKHERIVFWRGVLCL